MLHFLSNKYNYSFIKGKKNIYLQIMLCMFLGMSFSCGIQGTLGDIPGSRSLGNLQLNYYFSGKERNLLDSKKCIHIFLKKVKEQMFITTLFILTSNWKQSKYQSIVKQAK